MSDLSAEFLVIGSGIAGARAAIELSRRGQVLVLSKSGSGESSTEYAQGGIAVATNQGDSAELHLADTLAAGAGLCDLEAARILVEEGPGRIEELLKWGAHFDRQGDRLSYTREAAHSRHRILHAQGDATGLEISRTLVRRARSSPDIRLLKNHHALDLLVGPAGCEGVRVLELPGGIERDIRAKRVLLATGGLGAAFLQTTNPDVATGDGFAMALRCGATLADMEFVQFHPTVLKLEGVRPFLLTEALRGEGAYLCDASGRRFMTRYHPRAELAPRDVVSRAIVAELEARQEPTVFLDVRHLDPDFIPHRFPTVFARLLELGLDLRKDLIPVYPAAHYMMGGVATDVWGRTSVPGLYAAGEVACPGAHGANRLASNSLLDGLVFGARAGRAMAGAIAVWSPPGPTHSRTTHNIGDATVEVNREGLQETLTRELGMVRTASGLGRALRILGRARPQEASAQALSESENIRCNGLAIAAAALARRESRGSHFRRDYPEPDEADGNTHSLLEYSPASRRLEVSRVPTLQRPETDGQST